MSYFTNIPEIISQQIFSGAGSGPMLDAAAAWAALADELQTAAESFSYLISQLTSSWQSQASISMATVAKLYGGWLGTAAIQASGAAAGAESVAAIYEAARATVVHPGAIAMNRDRFVSLVMTNLFGFNAPAIAATDGEYEEMWATDIAAMVGYHSGANAIAEQLAPWQNALTGLSGQISAAAGGAGAPLPPAPAATAVEYGLIAALIATQLTPGVQMMAPLNTPLGDALGRLTQVATQLTAGPALITQAAAQLAAVAGNPALLTQAASQLSAVAVNPAVLTQAAAQLSAVAAAPTVLAAVTADPALITQAASRLSAVVANPAALASIANPALLTQAASQLSAVAANPVLLTQAASQLSAVAANPAVLTQAAAQLSALAANPAAIATVADPALLTQAARQLSSFAADPVLITRAASDLAALAANPAVLTQAASDLSAMAGSPRLITQTLEQLSATVATNSFGGLGGVGRVDTALTGVVASLGGSLDTRAFTSAGIGVIDAAAQLGSAIVSTPLTAIDAAAQLGGAIAGTPLTAIDAAAQLGGAIAGTPLTPIDAAAQLGSAITTTSVAATDTGGVAIARV